MTTSRARAVLFTKKGCLPCLKTKDLLNQLLTDSPDLGDVVSIMWKENHSALVESYNLELYPTLLIIDEEGTAVGRIVGGQLVRSVLPGVLTTLGALS